MKVEDIRKMSADELSKELTSLKEELLSFVSSMQQTSLRILHRSLRSKKDIAKVMTIKREKELAAAK